MKTVLLLLTAALTIKAQNPEVDALREAPFRLEKGWEPLFSGRDLAGWHSIAAWRGDPKRLDEWFAASRVDWSGIRSPAELTAKRDGGGILVNGDISHTSNLVSDRKFGDIELYVEFLISKGSNSGVYLQGLYEVQIFDSFGVPRALTYTGAGGIYQRWENDRGFGGTPPLRNASRAPGEWQWYHIWFQAPRFNASGRKTQNAKFVRVVYNGQTVQANVESDGRTRSSLEIPEAALNPIMLQGDHGPVAFRNMYVRPLRTDGEEQSHGRRSDQKTACQ